MKKLTILAACILMLFSSCDDNITLDFDNPTKKAQKVTFDGKEFTVWAMGTITKQVPRGEHTIQVGTESAITYNFVEDEYLINPLKETYVIENIRYSSSPSLSEFEKKFMESNAEALKEQGLEVKLDFESFSDLIKARDWDYKQREKAPEQLSVNSRSSSVSKTRRKLYALDELEELLKRAKRGRR